MLTPFALSGLLSGISSLLFGSLVLLRSRDRQIGRVWFLFTLACALWGLGVLAISRLHNPQDALWTWRCVYSFTANWIAPLFFHFVMIFTGVRERRAVLFQYAIASIFFVMGFTPWQYAQVQWFHDSYYCVAGKFYLLSSAWWLLLVFFSHYVLLRTYRTTSPLKKTQIKFFFVAMAFGFSGGVFDFLPPLGIDIYPWGNFTIFLYPLLMSYAILRHRLMDISLIIRKTLVYSVVMGTLTIIYMSVVTLFARLFEGLTGYQTIFSSAIAACLVTIGFQPLRKKVQGLVDAKFFRQYVDREEKLYELSREVITHTTSEAMAQSLIRVLSDTLHPKSAVLYLKSRDGDGFELVSQQGAKGIPRFLEGGNPLASYFQDHPQPFVQQDLPVNEGESLDTRRPERGKDAA